MQGHYDIILIFATYCVATATAYSVLELGSQLANDKSLRQRVWMLIGSLAVGTGIWSAHHLAMRSFGLPTNGIATAYQILAWGAAVCVAAAFLNLAQRARVSPTQAVTFGLLIGAGLSVIHYSGVVGAYLAPPMAISTNGISGLVLAGIAGSGLAYFTSFTTANRGKRYRLRAAASAAALICGLHFGYLSVAELGGFSAPEIAQQEPSYLTHTLLANLLSAGLTCFMLAAVLWLSVIDAKLAIERLRIAQELAESERLYRLAYYDNVTQLPNRILFTEKLLKQLVDAGAGAEKRPGFGLIYAELSNYRNLVEQLGQDRFDRILKTLAQQVSQSLQANDLLARLTPNGLILLVQERKGHDTQAVLNIIRAQLSTPVRDNDVYFRFMWGIGFSRYPEHGNSIQALLFSAMKIQSQIGTEVKHIGVATAASGYALAS